MNQGLELLTAILYATLLNFAPLGWGWGVIYVSQKFLVLYVIFIRAKSEVKYLSEITRF